MIKHPQEPIIRKNAGIVPLALYESQMGGRNHTYFTHDGALGRFHVAVWWVIGPTWVALIIRILRMIVHLGVFFLQLGGS